MTDPICSAIPLVIVVTGLLLRLGMHSEANRIIQSIAEADPLPREEKR